MPDGGVPWALLIALVALTLVELVIRQVEPSRLIPYPEHSNFTPAAVRHSLNAYGPADVVLVGSSRTREGFVVPRITERLEQEFDEPLRVANYGSSGSRSDSVEGVIRLMLDHEHKPRLIIYGVSPYQFQNNQLGLRRVTALWSLEDWFREREATGDDLMLYLSPVLRNEIENRYLTFAYREKVNLVVREWMTDYEQPPNPIHGELTFFQKFHPDQSLITRPLSEERIRKYVEPRLRDGKLPQAQFKIDRMKSAIALCREAGIPIVLFEHPLARQLVEAYPDEAYPEFVDCLKGIARDTNTPLITIDQIEQEFTDHDFREQVHLNYHGAVKLTDALLELVVIPELTRQRNGESPPAVSSP